MRAQRNRMNLSGPSTGRKKYEDGGSQGLQAPE